MENLKRISLVAREKLANIASKMPVGTPSKGGRKKGIPNVNTAKKAKISQHFASLGGQKVRGAAAQTARKFGIFGEDGASRILRIAKQVAEGKIEPMPHPGRPCAFDETLKEAIVEALAKTTRARTAKWRISCVYRSRRPIVMRCAT